MTVMRTCVGCRQRASQQELVRVVGQDGSVVNGTRPRLPGRGAYLHPATGCVEAAVRRRALSRALGVAVTQADVAAVLGWNPAPDGGTVA